MVDDKYYDLVSKCLERTIEHYKQKRHSSRAAAFMKESHKKSELSSSERIIIEVGNILDTKNKVNAIVNTTSSNLDLKNGTVSKLIFQKAGQSIQNELSANYKNVLTRTKVVAVSSSGNIKNIKNIFFISR